MMSAVWWANQRRVRRWLVAALGALVPSAMVSDEVKAQSGFEREFRITRWSVTAGQSFDTRTASHNESFGGAFQSAAVQASAPVFVWRGVRVAWLSEVLPYVRVNVAAPDHRIPSPDFDPVEANDPRRRRRYTRRNVHGFGLAPLGAETSWTMTARTHLMFNVTSGGVWFTDVVPYGKATQANFTVAPTLAVERRLGNDQALSFGYTMHHLSNASMGGANPGLNTHLVAIRWTRLR